MLIMKLSTKWSICDVGLLLFSLCFPRMHQLGESAQFLSKADRTEPEFLFCIQIASLKSQLCFFSIHTDIFCRYVFVAWGWFQWCFFPASQSGNNQIASFFTSFFESLRNLYLRYKCQNVLLTRLFLRWVTWPLSHSWSRSMFVVLFVSFRS